VSASKLNRLEHSSVRRQRKGEGRSLTPDRCRGRWEDVRTPICQGQSGFGEIAQREGELTKYKGELQRIDGQRWDRIVEFGKKGSAAAANFSFVPALPLRLLRPVLRVGKCPRASGRATSELPSKLFPGSVCPNGLVQS
jgi:hypothetical protein